MKCEYCDGSGNYVESPEGTFCKKVTICENCDGLGEYKYDVQSNTKRKVQREKNRSKHSK